MQIGPNGAAGNPYFEDDFTSLNLRTDTGGGPWTAALKWNPNDSRGTNWGGGDAWFANPLYPSSANAASSPYSTYSNPLIINSGGGLTIQATDHPGGFYTGDGNSSYATTSNWESAQITTAETYTSDGQTVQPGFTQTYGYFQVDAVIPTGSGWWPAFWLYADSAVHGQEIDVLEAYGQDANLNYPAVHDNAIPGAQGGLPNGVVGTASGAAATDGSAQTYGVDWEPDKITFYIQGVPVFTTATPADLVNTPMWLGLDLAVGSYGGSPSADSANFTINSVKTWTSTETAYELPVGTATTSADSYTPDANVVRVDISDSAHYLHANGLGDDFYLESPVAGGQTISGFTNLDMLDLTGVLYNPAVSGSSWNYTSDPNLISEGAITFLSDGNGGADIYFSKDGTVANRVLMADLTGVDHTTLSLTQGVVTTTDSGSGGGTAVATSDSSYTAPSGVTDITLTGSQQTVTGNNAGDTFHSDNTLNHLTGGTGNDTFILGRAGDVATGGGGSDIFVYNEVPWAAGEITDFDTSDAINLQHLIQTTGYTGSDPVGAGYLKFVNDANGNAQIWANYDPADNAAPWLVTTVDHVSSAQLQLQDGLVTETAPSVATSAADYVAPSYVTSITLTGSQQTIDASATDGVLIVSNNSGNILTGGTGGDTFDLGRGGDIVTGGAGADVFSYAETPWAGGTITNFNAAQGDEIDVSNLLAHSSYTGSDPFGDGYLKYTTDGTNTQLWSDVHQSGNDGWWLVATIDNVSPGSLSYGNGHIT